MRARRGRGKTYSGRIANASEELPKRSREILLFGTLTTRYRVVSGGRPLRTPLLFFRSGGREANRRDACDAVTKVTKVTSGSRRRSDMKDRFRKKGRMIGPKAASDGNQSLGALKIKK
jgi:hypothetical protein